MKYQQPYGISDPLAPYINGDPSIGRQGSIPPAGAFEENQRELTNWIVLSGMTPNGGDRVAGGDLYQVAKSAQAQKVNFAIDTGTQNAMRAIVQPAIGTYQPGLVIRCQALFSSLNDGTHTTLTLDGGAGPAPVVKPDGSMPATNDLKAGGVYQYVFDNAGRWQLMTVGGPSTGGSTTVNVKIPYCRDTGTVANQIRAIYSPAITTVTEGDFIAVKLAISLVTGVCMITINALSPLNVRHPDGTNPNAGDAVANQTLLLCYDGTAFQIIGVIGVPSVTRPRILLGVPPTGNQFVVPATTAQLTCYTQVINTTLVTSTVTGGGVFTCGAGEDGLWQFDGAVGFGNLTTSEAVYWYGTRKRSGQPDLYFLQSYFPYGSLGVSGAPVAEDTSAHGHGMVELQVGDQCIFTVALWAAGGPYQVMGPSPTAAWYPNLQAHLVSRHLI